MSAMVAMQLDAPGSPLRRVERAIPQPGLGEVLVEVLACGVCRTDLHVVDGDIHGKLPIIPGHEVVGRAIALGERDGPAAGLRALADVDRERLGGYQPFFAARADLLARAGRLDEARWSYDRAIELTSNPSERAFLAVRRAALAVRS